ncbi:NCS2 family permease [Persicobacter sp. CCB-QB2]|uniref:NCS2 family permease n=1 Tax=Persicobacter sp. CCB-QB2 TaxID=1561025 RepID=UPI0006A9640E|nr:NCS2 family permease [Persicobacter sp. CCB-QB2]
MEKFFNLQARGTNVRQEVFGGITTFLTMAYIIFVNPNLLGIAGMDQGALITVTCLASIIGTLLAAFWAKVPFAMAPGMGLNAFFTFTLVKGQGASWEEALGVVFISGIVFLILTVIGVREKIVSSIPVSLRLAVGAGIGLFICFIGFQNMGPFVPEAGKVVGLIVDNPATLVGLGTFNTATAWGLAGLVLIGILEVRRVKGSILIGIVCCTLGGMLTGDVQVPDAIIAMPKSIAPIALKLDVLGALKLSMIGAIFSFMFVDLFDSIGTIVACSYEAKMVEKDGNIPVIGKVLEADALATVIGSLLGTSTTTTYVESAAGISSGARTGLASVVTAGLFFIAMFFGPLIGVVPAFATAPALVIVGVFMFKNINQIDFKDFNEAIPAFLTIILMPLTYSISTGLSFGFIAYTVIAIANGRALKLSPTMWFITILSLINLYFTMTGGGA